MCGLVLTRDEKSARVALDAMPHRGLPGRARTQTVGPWTLGHVRLPIQGLTEKFDQPYQHEEWTIAFVGEIFNFREIDPGAESDVQVAARVWTEDGPSGFKQFDGFWAFVAVDNRTFEAHVLTDYLAQKPLYVSRDECVVASEIRAVADVIGWTVDPLFMSSVRKFGYHVGNQSPVMGVEKISPSRHIVFDAGGRVTRDFVYDRLCPTPRDIRSEIERAVERRLISDVPVCALSSGGLDSTIVVQIARRHADVRTYHVENGEAEFAREVSPGVVMIHTEDVSVEDALDANEGPQDLGSMIPQVALARALAIRGEHVVLSGDGADELFGGYRRSKEYDSQWSDVFEELVHYHLPRLDKVMMRSTIELRSPFLARGVVEGALALPREARTGKKILRELFSDIVPKNILERKKHPLKSQHVLSRGIEWSRHLCDVYEEILSEKRFEKRWKSRNY